VDNQLIFLLGGARSGKSAYAEHWARQHGQQVLFVATAQAFDAEMTERINRHKASRPAHWTTLEAPLTTGRAIRYACAEHPYDTIVVDCLTLLATNALLQLPESATQAESDDVILAEVDGLLETYYRSSATWLIVSNEVGMGIVPPSKLGRLFQDSLGRANQKLAQAADVVNLLVAGLPWQIKP
jgi:adenosylcobinamide kinase / adenosylcobinamide-phosphate guanylyltransferase